MTEVEELAPHQQRLAELLGKSAPASQDGDTARSITSGWLAELKADPGRALWGMRITLDSQRGGSSAMWAKLAMDWSEYHGLADPADPSAAAFCDHCGNTEPDELDRRPGLGTDVPCRCHGMLTRPCKDADACVQRREERYPSDLSRVPSWVLTAGSPAAAEAEAASAMVRAAVGQAAAEYYLELTAAAADDELELAAPSSGAWSTKGDWYPAQPVYNFNWSHYLWSHTLHNPAHRQHLISGGAQLTPAKVSAMAQVSQARGAQQAQGGAQQARGGGQGTRAPSARTAPGQALEPPGGDMSDITRWGRHSGADVGGGDPPAGAAGGGPAPRPARSRRKSRMPQYGNRRGRLRYSGEAAHGHTGGSGSYSGAETGGPSGGSSET